MGVVQTFNRIMLGQKTMAESSPVVLASDQPAFPVIISGGGGGSSSAAGLTVVTPDPALFYDPLVIFVNSTTEWRAVHFDSQVLDPVSSAVFSAIPFQLAVSSDLTQLWAWEGVTAGTQVFQKITIATNTSVSSTTITGIDANEIIQVAAVHPLTGAAYVACRREPEADGLISLYSFNTDTAVATKIGDGAVFLSTSFNGLTIFPDGTCWLASNPSGTRTIYKLDLDTAEATLIYSNAGSSPWDFEDLAATCRNSFLAVNANGSGLSEGSYNNFALIRRCIGAGASNIASVMLPPISRKFYLGMPIYKVDDISAGLITATNYFLQDGTNVTTSLSGIALLPFAQFESEQELVQAANYAVGTLAFGSVTTAYATLFTPVSSWLPATRMKINNELNVPVYLSFDGSTNHIYVGAGEILVLPLRAVNRVGVTTTIRVKSAGAAAASGNIYATVVY